MPNPNPKTVAAWIAVLDSARKSHDPEALAFIHEKLAKPSNRLMHKAVTEAMEARAFRDFRDTAIRNAGNFGTVAHDETEALGDRRTAMNEARNEATRLAAGLAGKATLWACACAFDCLNPAEPFAVWSDTNPYGAAWDKITLI